eukprot:CAMPEP_0172808342 /NCGR_PEP_ID=MMETSP1075-20121228/7621_1 /TAXON_ID=2916 /ORGANISM="Ceratium fusus, Strain PA161109" /LENGTH=169 /DNA_ID=CAMNT_0013647481 /DNA_START=162 /DNA_END=670 /DNA_ORIENTATION=+
MDATFGELALIHLATRPCLHSMPITQAIPPLAPVSTTAWKRKLRAFHALFVQQFRVSALWCWFLFQLQTVGAASLILSCSSAALSASSLSQATTPSLEGSSEEVHCGKCRLPLRVLVCATTLLIESSAAMQPRKRGSSMLSSESLTPEEREHAEGDHRARPKLVRPQAC